MGSVSTSRVADVFVEVADTLVDDFDLIDFLQMLTVRTAELVTADAVGLLLADQAGNLQLLASSTEGARLLELFQLQNDDGPCLDAYHSGESVHVSDLDSARERWPHFAAYAVADGFASVHAMPLRLRETVIGAMGIFSAGEQELTEADEHVVRALSHIATIGLLQERSIRRSEALSEQLQGALNSRIVIEQAKGLVAARYDTSVDAAFELLRGYARRNNRRLSEVAHAVLEAGAPDLRA